MKKIFISIPALLVMTGCNYDPVLTSKTEQPHGSLGILLIICSLGIIMMVCTWPKKKKIKY